MFHKTRKALFDDVVTVQSITEGIIPIPTWARVPDDGNWDEYDSIKILRVVKENETLWYAYFAFYCVRFLFLFLLFFLNIFLEKKTTKRTKYFF